MIMITCEELLLAWSEGAKRARDEGRLQADPAPNDQQMAGDAGGRPLAPLANRIASPRSPAQKKQRHGRAPSPGADHPTAQTKSTVEPAEQPTADGGEGGISGVSLPAPVRAASQVSGAPQVSSCCVARAVRGGGGPTAVGELMLKLSRTPKRSD